MSELKTEVIFYLIFRMDSRGLVYMRTVVYLCGSRDLSIPAYDVASTEGASICLHGLEDDFLEVNMFLIFHLKLFKLF